MDMTGHIKSLSLEGYTIVEGAINDAGVDYLLRKAMTDHNSDQEGVLNHIPELAPLMDNQEIMGAMESMMGGDICLANGMCVRRALPGGGDGFENLHPDLHWAEVPADRNMIPFWHSMVVCWALTPCAYENGTLLVVPFSHHAEAYDPKAIGVPTHKHEVPVVMNPGDAVMMHGALWHRRGPNRTDTTRFLIHGFFLQRQLYDFDDGKTVTCCYGQWAGIGDAVHQTFSERVQELTLLSTLPGRGGRS